MSEFLRRNWHKLMAAILVIALLLFVYIWLFARPVTEHRGGDSGKPLGTISITRTMD